MHPSLQQRVDGLKALRLRNVIATAEFYSLIGKEPPVQKIRYQVIAKGTNAFHITEVSTGKVKGFRFTYKEAMNFAQALEARADGVKVTLSGDRQ
ncbi:hypothetical protein [Pseudomonas sp. 58(2021)]|uniref:hypothetical protein n=1 Tax=Pseudomonas sp. 58(2021) TaxID=2813330 RepID=UPI001A9DA391|nr:hypothetical protein [Pseudomonas sp. 58(2021)]